jgi:XRE family aerobic/anaerobic benzoate catabolism transcriptional regulator
MAGGEARFLKEFGSRVRGERTRRGMTRRALAESAEISERYVTLLESGKGNVSLLVLKRVSEAFGLPLASLLGDEPDGPRARRVALIGLRGAGKTTLGAALAKERRVPFVELDREVERLSGAPIGSLLELYGPEAYRRREREALERLLESRRAFVVATGGGLVSEAATYDLLLERCFTVWVKASPEEHMARVLAQGDKRPIAASGRAMEDLKRILAERTPLYARAHATVDTAGERPGRSLEKLRGALP